MQRKIQREVRERLFRNRSNQKFRMVSAALSVLVVMGTVTGLILPAHTLTRKTQVLDCQYATHTHTEACYGSENHLICGYADYVTHRHDDSCYQDGKLVCTLPEIPEHKHTDACYQQQQVLVCGMEESAEHQHDANCYETVKELTCGQQELHTHTADCYDENGQLTCGLMQLEQHQHGNACFKTVEQEEPQAEQNEPAPAEAAAAQPETNTNEGNAAAETPTASAPATAETPAANAPTQDTEQQETPAAVAMPAQQFDGSTDAVTVHAEAPEGALPEGTSMTVTKVTEKTVIDTVTDAVNGKVKAVEAVDITFRNASGQEIEPAKEIRVTMTSKQIAKAEESVVVHVDDEGKAEVVEKKEEKPAENAVVFNADAFSVYALAYTVDFEYEVDGKTYKYSMQGGSAIGLKELLPILGVVKDDTATEKNEVDAFVSDIADVRFSDESLVQAAHVDKDTTVGALKDKLGLDIQYSSKLTEEDIAKINAKELKAVDWALISMQPFSSEESLTVTMKNGDVWTIKVTDAQSINGATVHYGYMEGNTFHEFTPAEFTPPTSGFGRPAYLIYDVPNYQYAGTTYYSRNNITDMRYASTTAPIIERTSSGHYYVTYEPRPAAKPGGSIYAKSNFPEDPTVTKTSVENPATGTNTISLEVEGKRKTAKSKADIIVIYDVSGSMNFDIEGIEYCPTDDVSRQRHPITKKAINDLADALMVDGGGDDADVRMGLVSFSTVAGVVTPLTGDKGTFIRDVNNLQLGGGTNWEDALQIANSMDVRTNADTYIVFVTDGNPTVRVTRGDISDSNLSSIGGKSGMNRALYDPYGVFGTGNSDAATTSQDSLTRNYNAAFDVASSIVDDQHKKLYGIGISADADKLTSLVDSATHEGGNSYIATTSGAVENAINNIKLKIKELTFGYSDVQITDGITALTQTVQKTGMTTLPDSDDFEYFKGHAATQADVDAGRASNVGETVWEPWTEEQMNAEGAGRASYNSSTGAVEWNLGDTFMLEDEVSYKVDFTVWPSQEALDILADINNSCRRDKDTGALTTYASTDAAYESLPEDVKRQIYKDEITGKYVLKTNEDSAGYSYKTATMDGNTGVVTTHGEAISDTFPKVIPLNLRTDKIGVEKSFSNLLDSRDPTQIQLELWGNRLFKTFTLTKDGQWKSDDNFISCGLLTVDKSTGEVYIYETGHDFTLKETGEDSIYWELTADTYHPMIINDVLHMLSKVDAPAGMPSDAKYYSANGKEYYRIGENVYRDEGTDAVLKAVNDHRSFLDLSKEVVDASNNQVDDDQLFTFKCKFTEARTDDDIIFTVYDTVNKVYIDNLETTATLTPADDVTNTRPYYVVADNEEFTLKIKQGWNVRFLNLSNDTTYTIEEVLAESSEYSFVKIEGDAQKKAEGDSTASVDTHMTITPESPQMSGTIAEANVLYSVKYTNKPPKKEIQILKTDQAGSTPLQNAEFSLYGSDYYDTEGNVNPEAQALESNKKTDQNGILDLGQYTYGTYYLVEEKAPEGYIKIDTPIKIVLSSSPEYEQSGSSLSMSGNGITPLKDDNQKVIGYQFIVTNNAGYELPSTGGIGTTIFYVIGSILVIGAGVLLVTKKRMGGK